MRPTASLISGLLNIILTVLTKPLLEYYGQTSPKPVRSQALQPLQSESFDVF